MENNVKERRFFPGANSAYGFYSFFDQIAPPQAKKIFILKGGPGVGKSTFMKKIGKEMQRRGFDVEYHHCASDSDSLDALVIPRPGIVFMDGTAPHVVDPEYPGAVEEIIYIGSFWNKRGLMQNRESIISLSTEIRRLFKHVYRLLAVARVYLEALESYADPVERPYQDAWNLLALELMEEILEGKSAGKRPGRIRKLFASAISPGGMVNFLDSIVAGLDKIYILHGPNGKGKGKIMQRVADAALMRGFCLEAYHCAFDPHRIDHMIIPELGVALINSMEPHCFSPSEAWWKFDTGTFVPELSQNLQEEKHAFQLSYQNALKQAVNFLNKAKVIHDELEKLYIPNMDFTRIDRLCYETLERVLEFGNNG